jgi:hypothetical protein
MEAIGDKYRHVHPDRAAAYVDEGRTALVELLGRLAMYYRDRYLSNDGSDIR